MINLKATPGKEDAEQETHFLLQSNLNFNFEEMDDSNDTDNIERE